jgi:hypothetical protein
MKNLKIEQHQLLGELVYNCKEIINFYDFSPQEQLEFILTKIRIAKETAEGLTLTKTYDALERIETRLNQLANIKKKHLISTRVRDILEEIKW